jgi:hypothetical protein
MLETLTDTGPLNQFKKAYPKDVGEIFAVSGDGGWSTEEKLRFEGQKKKIYLSAHKFNPYVLEERADD